MEHKIKTPIDVACFIRDYIKGKDVEYPYANEDNLYQKVLEEVVKGNPRARKMAELALKTKQLDIKRWYA